MLFLQEQWKDKNTDCAEVRSTEQNMDVAGVELRFA